MDYRHMNARQLASGKLEQTFESERCQGKAEVWNAHPARGKRGKFGATAGERITIRYKLVYNRLSFAKIGLSQNDIVSKIIPVRC